MYTSVVLLRVEGKAVPAASQIEKTLFRGYFAALPRRQKGTAAEALS
jgi:hypothetical protein